ncbi:hypothetical protein E308F_30270 [Moorella sp. E308F]|uniref:ATP-binding protein n=1 Tax=Moorella sp. E308F TaxID=2572682 RepID=UPI0010FFBFFB|nr:ATP-binding protein [Moorella sp. E308F]GEA16781.1 hypothetical protein E308F_30270 [Moorella sp. E308F]
MPPYTECENCVATGFCKAYSGEVVLTNKKNWCSARFRLYKALKLAQIPIEYWRANLTNYILDKDNEKVYQKIKPKLGNIVEEVKRGFNLFFYSDKFGTGKTYHAAMFLNHYIYKVCLTREFDFETPPALFVVYPDLMDKLRMYKDEMQDYLTWVKEVPLVLFDDIGAGTMTDFTREQTYLILNHRFNNRLSTIITSNLSLSKLGQDTALGERNVSRLTAHFQGIVVSGEDRRRKR